MLNFRVIKRMLIALIEAGINEKHDKVEFDAELIKYHEIINIIKDMK